MSTQRGNRGAGGGAVYVQTNESGGNRLMAFDRNTAGALMSASDQLTGGAGDGVPHLKSQGSVVLTTMGSTCW